MNIVAANKHFTVQHHSVLHSNSLEQIFPRNSFKQSTPADNRPTSLTTHSTEIYQAQPTSAMPEIPEQKPEQKSSAVTESTSSNAQNEDKQRLNKLQSVDAVERILDQLSTGKLLSWIDGNSMEKIQAQLTGQQRAIAAANDLPLLSAQSIATSFGLYDGEALMSRIARSGIFLEGQNSVTVFDNKPELHQVDLNI